MGWAVFFPRNTAGVGPAVYHLFSPAAFFLPLEPGRPARLQLQCPLSSHLQPSMLFVSFLLLPSVVFLSHLHFFTLLSCPPFVLELNCHPPHHQVLIQVLSSCCFDGCWYVFHLPEEYSLHEDRVSVFPPATGVLSWLLSMCSCLNNVRGEFISCFFFFL